MIEIVAVDKTDNSLVYICPLTKDTAPVTDIVKVLNKPFKRLTVEVTDTDSTFPRAFKIETIAVTDTFKALLKEATLAMLTAPVTATEKATKCFPTVVSTTMVCSTTVVINLLIAFCTVTAPVLVTDNNLPLKVLRVTTAVDNTVKALK